MNKKISDDEFNVLRKISVNPSAHQRELANNLGFSLGKTKLLFKRIKIKRAS